MSCYAFGTVAGHPAQAVAGHREGNSTPVALQVVVSVPLSLDDVTAVLWSFVGSGMPVAELGSDEDVHRLMLEALLGVGGLEVAALACEIENMTPQSVGYDVLTQLRERVAQLYGQPAPVRVPSQRTDQTSRRAGQRAFAAVAR